ncbi:MAG TPA: serine hydrolase domain-containing protein, partial [Polyangiaceae bacterium]|nr:serine hydrolase domain-containing protein [Polyangiaceae bacterium]
SEITVRQLLQHTSGLNEYLASPAVLADAARPWSPAELVDAAVALGPVSEPGAEHHYANTNYILLGELVAALDGQPWHEAVRARIQEPLGMQHTGYIGQPSALPMGPGYGLEEGQFVDYTTRLDPSLGGAAGGLESTASDLMRFGRALIDGRLLDEPSWTQMRAFVPAEPYDYVSHEYGLGFEKYTANELAVYGHLGTSAAHTAFFGFDPESGAVAAVLINARNSPPPALMTFEALGALAGKDVGPPAAPAP